MNNYRMRHFIYPIGKLNLKRFLFHVFIIIFFFIQDLRREEINKKLEEAEQKEREELSSQRKELFTERRAKQAELRILQRKVDMAELVNRNDFIMNFS